MRMFKFGPNYKWAKDFARSMLSRAFNIYVVFIWEGILLLCVLIVSTKRNHTAHH